MSDEIEIPKFSQVPSFLDNHPILQQAWDDSIKAIENHYLSSTVYSLFSLLVGIYYGLSSSSFINIVFCCVVLIFFPLLIIFITKIIYAPGKVIKQKNETISDKDHELRQKNTEIEKLPVQLEKRFKSMNKLAEIPKQEPKTKQELATSLNGLIAKAETLLKDYKYQQETTKNSNNEFNPYISYRRKATEWQKELESFIVTNFPEYFFDILKFDQDFTPGGVRHKIEILREEIKKLENNSFS